MATFPYENASPERFQEFCQALLLSEFPGLQCLPVGQPDGGRDAIGTLVSGSKPVIQVKMKRKQESVGDHASWIIGTLQNELSKIDLLIERGMTEYIVATNVQGSSHLDVGEIDLVQHWLNENVKVPSRCFWRSDLDRRFEGATALKFAYPELLSGPDGLRLALESALASDGARRATVLRSFVAEQYDRDSTVRFKQVELKNDLFPLYIDVPLTLRLGSGKRRMKSERHFRTVLRHVASMGGRAIPDGWINEDGYYSLEYRRVSPALIGAGEFLLDEAGQNHFKKIVLEGAPGQGKSTLSQYVCQVHRSRFLDRWDDLNALPVAHRAGPARIPIKVDLRDLATWLNKRNPFEIKSTDVPRDWRPSLEAFIGFMIQSLSGGLSFEPVDVVETVKSAPTLLVFDGLDEVADIRDRKEMIDTVSQGIRRLEAQGANLQVLITSRPAAFANSPGFSPLEFHYMQLADLPRAMVMEYAERWVKAKDLVASEAAEVKRIIAERLESPHIRDLARNPMQLAILLSVIHSVGQSLPDQRTALYDTYLDKFLTREAEKSVAVKKHRRLLVKIHQYLAWRLHTQVEMGQAQGSLTSEELRQEITEYLTTRGHRLDVVDELFGGIVERVVVLVQRIEGRYEFEVQPIREYFAAAYLYETAPPSRRGLQNRGTISHRFAAMASNRFWLNVVRFYAGNYSEGELADLFLHFKAMHRRPLSVSGSHPRYLGALLLSDWVFEASPLTQTEMVDLTFDTLGLRCAAHGFAVEAGVGPPLTLPEECGAAQLREAAVRQLELNNAPEVRRELCTLLRTNGGRLLGRELLEKCKTAQGKRASYWLQIAADVGALATDKTSWLELIGREPEEKVERVWIVAGARPDWIQTDIELSRIALASAMAGREYGGLEVLRERPTWLALLLAGATPTWLYYTRTLDLMENALPRVDPRLPEVSAILAVQRDLPRKLPVWDSSAEPWRNWVDSIQSAFGEVWAAYEWAGYGAGWRAHGGRGAGMRELFDSSKPLSERARYARMRRSDSRWWLAQANKAESPVQNMFWIYMAMAWLKDWSDRDVVVALEERLSNLEDEEYLGLARAFKRRAEFRHMHLEDISSLPRAVSARHIGLRVLGAPMLELSMTRRRQLSDESSMLGSAADLILSKVIRLDIGSAQSWPAMIRKARELFSSGRMPDLSLRSRSDGIPMMPLTTAKTIVDDPLSYPYEILTFALHSIRLNETARPVHEVANTDNWKFVADGSSSRSTLQ